MTVKSCAFGIRDEGVTLCVAASDLIPEVNKLPGPRVALTVGASVALVLLLRFCFLGSAVP
ncbi:MAG TPA: hypothetical protein VEO19_02910 [Terriglobia bacterium]|nr:hypothetical protein [Terriglobia bacterium]